MYKLVIFDFDGTLVDSAPGIVDVMRQVVDEYQLPLTILDEWKQLVGVPLGRQMEIIFPDKDVSFWNEVANRYRTIYNAKTIEICPLFPGVPKLLKALSEAQIEIAIASSKRRPLIEVVLNHFGLSHYFGLVVGDQDVKNHKPHPESVQLAVQTFGTSLSDSVVIGDSLYDLDMARNAGVDAIGVTTGIHTREILRTAEPKFIVDGLEQVLPIILNGRMK